MTHDRRSFLKTAAGASALALLPPNLRAALAEPFPRRTGTIADVEHVVIFMQENRSFDHYFGTLKGVRGFSDPRAITLPSGKPVWYQPKDGEEFTPFHLDSRTTSAQCLASLDHSWKGAYDLWKNYDAWIPTKTKMTMGYFDRRDIPFFHALADSFTICDAYHCSVFGPTNPNRLHLFSGTSGLTAGYDGTGCVANPSDEDNETADIRNDSKKFKPFEWATYAEALEAAGVDWRVYQEYDNFGDNGLAYFKDFRAPVHHPKLVERGRSWVKGSNKENAKTSRGEHLVSAFAEDVALGRLPKVSWIVAPTIMSEHPQAPPGFGESLMSRLLDALAANRKVWSKTAFILNYDENDGFFDHVPPAIPPLTSDIGASTVSMAGEDYHGVPFGFGPRVPMLVISPWSVGGFVNSQLFDHTSVLRFLETRFGVAAPNISAWRRAVAGDLTSAFDFSQEAPPALPEAGDSMKRAEKQCKLPAPNYAREDLPRQESGGKARPAAALCARFRRRDRHERLRDRARQQRTRGCRIANRRRRRQDRPVVLHGGGGQDPDLHPAPQRGLRFQPARPQRLLPQVRGRRQRQGPGVVLGRPVQRGERFRGRRHSAQRLRQELVDDGRTRQRDGGHHRPRQDGELVRRLGRGPGLRAPVRGPHRERQPPQGAIRCWAKGRIRPRVGRCSPCPISSPSCASCWCRSSRSPS